MRAREESAEQREVSFCCSKEQRAKCERPLDSSKESREKLQYENQSSLLTLGLPCMFSVGNGDTLGVFSINSHVRFCNGPRFTCLA